MTTIIYNHKEGEIGYDSRLSADNNIITDEFEKKYSLGGDRTFILSGCAHDFDDFVEGYPDEPKREFLCTSVMIEDEVAYMVYTADGIWRKERLLYNDSLGSGGKYAISALDFGCSTKEAVEYAITKDAFSGGEVKIILL